MSWKSEFNTQWQAFLESIETKIRREIEAQGRLDPSGIHRFIQAEVSKWSLLSYSNGTWLRDLSQEQPTLGEQFRTVLQELEAEPRRPLSLRPNLPLPEVGVAAGLMGAAFGIAKALGMSLLGQLGGPLAIAALAVPIIGDRWTAAKREAANAVIKQLREDLEPIGSRLRAIAQQADEASIGNR